MKKGACRFKASAIVAGLLLLVLCLIPAPVNADILSISPIQGIVGTDVTIGALSVYGTGEFYIYWGDEKQVLKHGTGDESESVTFSIPEAARGIHKVILKIEGKTFDAEFTVMPSISLGTHEGKVGSELIVTGKGFNQNETDIEITFDGNTIETGIKADSNGNWQNAIKIPDSHSGEHIIIASGTTPAEEVGSQTFSIVPKIDITPKSGGVNTMVTINGSGFGNAETGIVVTYDGLAVKTAIASTKQGSWKSSFFVPASTKGSHKIDAYGDTTDSTTVAEVTFNVAPSIKLEMVSGHLGDTIHTGDSFWVSGIGFEENETGIQVTFDGIMLASGITADAKGTWAVQLEVPQSTQGAHTVDTSGETTSASDIANATLIISPKIEINPTSGAISEDVVVTGTGFGGSQPLTISYDGNQVATDSATDSKGSFTVSFEVPKSKAGDHTITVADAIASVASASYSVESTPPPTPRLISPEAGKRSGFFGKTIITFEWSDVDDPSGVIYLLEISQNVDFSGTMLRKENLSQPQYTLTEEEAMSKGEYYWRVKAIDGASNEGEWTTGQLFKVGVMEPWMLAVIIIAGLGILLFIGRIIQVSRRGGWK